MFLCHKIRTFHSEEQNIMLSAASTQLQKFFFRALNIQNSYNNRFLRDDLAEMFLVYKLTVGGCVSGSTIDALFADNSCALFWSWIFSFTNLSRSSFNFSNRILSFLILAVSLSNLRLFRSSAIACRYTSFFLRKASVLK